jgi:hypothetical protein
LEDCLGHGCVPLVDITVKNYNFGLRISRNKFFGKCGRRDVTNSLGKVSATVQYRRKVFSRPDNDLTAYPTLLE